MAYQSHEGERSDSASSEKLERLRLPQDLSGMSFLDLGCNEGYFCGVAVKRGASRVVGVDANSEVIERGRKLYPAVEFRHGTWWELPDEKFDLILISSALHYEPKPKLLLQRLLRCLKSDGMLILEFGAYRGTQLHRWNHVVRHDGILRFPTLSLAMDVLLSDYVVRYIGESVTQPGDPLPRYVVHAYPRRPTVVLIQGRSGAGKTALMQMLGGDRLSGAVSTDELIHMLSIKNPELVYSYSRHLPAWIDRFRERFSPAHIDVVTDEIVAGGLAQEFANWIARAIPLESPVTLVEGYALNHKPIRDELALALTRDGCVVWETSRWSEPEL